MGKYFMCPFFRYEKNGFSYCEHGSRIRFGKVKTQIDYQKEHCLDIDGWRKCSIAKALEKECGGKDEE